MAAQAADITHRRRMKSASYGEVIVNSLDNLRRNDELCDFTVSAGGKSIRVHKVLLAATSDYFRAMLQGANKEASENCVDLKALTAESLDQIVNFVYSGVMTLDFETLVDVLNASSHLQVQTALDLCSEYMISLLTFSNADELLSIANTYTLNRVTDHYNEKVLNNFEDFCQTEKFLKLSAGELSHFMADDGLRVKSENLLYDILAKWYSHDQSHRSESIDSLLKCIRFPLMTEAHLTNIRQHWLTSQCMTSMNYISEGLKYHADANVGHPWLSNNARVRSMESSLTLITQPGSAYRPFEITAFDESAEKHYQLITDNSGSRDCRIATLKNFVYISRVVDCGGGTLMNSLLRFDPRHLKLQELATCSRLRIDPALAARENWLYLFGGTNEYLTVLDTVECYDIRSNTWVELAPLPTPLHSLSTAVYKNHIYISGGASGLGQPVNALHQYDPTTQVWRSKTSMHCPRRLHEMVVHHDDIYVLGGIGVHYHQQTQIPIEMYNVAADQWTLLSTTLAGRSVGHFLKYRNKIISIGREHYDATEEDIWSYDRESDSWTLYCKLPRRGGPPTYGLQLYVNFSDEKISKRLITDKR